MLGIFDELNGKKNPSFRNLFSILLRDERSEFTYIIKCHDLKQRIPDDFTAHLFFLVISLDAYKNTLEKIKEIGKIDKVLAENKKELTQGNKKIADVKAELIDLKTMLDQLRLRQKAIRHDYEKIIRMTKPEQVDNSEIELVYNQFKSDLGDAIVKTLNEVVNFKNSEVIEQKCLFMIWHYYINKYTRKRYPLFLVHDNIFDVDQDTLVRCLNYVYKKEEQYQEK